MASLAAILAIGKPVALDASALDRRHPRVHLDDDQPPVVRVDRELDVAAAGVHADLAQDRDAQVAHPLVFPVGQRHGRRDGDRVAGVHAHRVEVLDRAHHHDVVVAVAHQLELEFLPAVDRFLDQHVGAGASRQPRAGHPVDLLDGARHARARPPIVKLGRTTTGRPSSLDRLAHLSMVRRTRLRADSPPDLADDVLEPLPVLAALDGVEVGADQLDAVALQHPVLVQRHRRFSAVCPPSVASSASILLPRSACWAITFSTNAGVMRLDVGVVGVLRVGHDRGRVGVDQADL